MNPNNKYWGADEDTTPTIYEKLFVSFLVFLFVMLMSIVLGSCNSVKIYYPPAYTTTEKEPVLAAPVRKTVKGKKVKQKFTVTF